MPFSWETANFIRHIIISLPQQAILPKVQFVMKFSLYLETNGSQIMTSTCEDSSKLTDATLPWWGGTLDIQDSRKQKELELPQTAVSLDNAKVSTVGRKNSGSKEINLI